MKRINRNLLHFAALFLFLSLFLSWGMTEKMVLFAESNATGTISGVVTDWDNQPVFYHGVTLYAYTYDPFAFVYSWEQQSHQTTNETGAYLFTDLPLDTSYRLGFASISYDSSPRHMAEYFDNVETFEAAKILTPTNVAAAVVANAKVAKGRIGGRILGEKGETIPNLSISAQGSTTGYELTTDETGRYTMTGLMPGAYKICAYSIDYLSGCYGNMFDNTQATTLTLSLQQPYADNINFSLSTGAHITGRVTGESGEPIQYVDVYGLKYSSNGIDPVSWNKYRTSYTDAMGYYTMTALPEGTYRVQFQPGFNAQAYIGEYFNDVTSLESAQGIVLTQTQNVANINAQLPLGGRITGSVLDKDNNPAYQGMIVTPYKELFIPSGGSYWDMARGPAGYDLSAFVNEQGLYTVTGLLTGTYRLRVWQPQYYENAPAWQPEFYQDVSAVENATDIAVQIRQIVPNINFKIGQMGTIKGRVTDSSNNPIVNIEVSGEISRTSGGGSDSWQPLAISALTDSNGQYTLTRVSAGQVRLKFAEYTSNYEPSRGYVTEYYNDSTTPEGATLISITTDDVITGIDAQLEKLGVIAGILQDWNGVPISNTSIYRSFYSDCCGWTPDYYNSFPVGNQGEFSFRTEDTRNYGVNVGSSDLYPAQYYNGQLSIVNLTPVSATKGMTTSIIFQLIPYGSISGTVTSITGTPLSGIAIMLWRKVDLGGGNFMTENMGSTQTNSQGKYAFGPLSGKTNTLPASTTTVFYVEFSDTRQPTRYQGEFYNHGTDISSATPVTVLLNTVVPVNTQLDLLVVNQAPVAQNDAISLIRGTTSNKLVSGAKNVLANDSDAEGTQLQATVITNPTNGTLVLNPDGTFVYTHNGSKTTNDFFTYRASDGVNQSNVATVTVTVQPLIAFDFSKTVGIVGIEPSCGEVGTMKVPVTTTINYCYSITNRGDVSLTMHSLVDDQLGVLLNDASLTVAPGTTYHTQFSQTLTVNTTNIATWTASANVESFVESLQSSDLEIVSGLTNENNMESIKQATIIISSPTDDQDGDTIPDNLERAGDADGDNIPNFLDTDSNNNGTPDAVEVGTSPLSPQDSNNNGIPDYQEVISSRSIYLPIISR